MKIIFGLFVIIVQLTIVLCQDTDGGTWQQFSTRCMDGNGHAKLNSLGYMFSTNVAFAQDLDKTTIALFSCTELDVVCSNILNEGIGHVLEKENVPLEVIKSSCIPVGSMDDSTFVYDCSSSPLQEIVKASGVMDTCISDGSTFETPGPEGI